MSIFWLRVALGLYGVGLLYALVALTRTSDLLNKVALHAAYLGMVFHFVSLTEGLFISGHVTLAMVHNSESLLAFLIMAVFMITYLIYKTTSPGIVVFPLVFLLTFMAATGQQPFITMSGSLRTSWLFAHIGAHLHRICGTVPEFLRQRSLPDPATFIEGKTRQRNSGSAAGARRYRSNRLPFAAAGFSLHDARLDRRLGCGAEHIWAH